MADRLTPRELGALTAHAVALVQLRRITSAPQRDIGYQLRIRFWHSILLSAIEARAHG